MSENKKVLLKEILNNKNDLNILYDFFSKIYYENDLISISNCFNYNMSEIEIIDLIKLINENDFKIILKNDY